MSDSRVHLASQPKSSRVRKGRAGGHWLASAFTVVVRYSAGDLEAWRRLETVPERLQDSADQLKTLFEVLG